MKSVYHYLCWIWISCIPNIQELKRPGCQEFHTQGYAIQHHPLYYLPHSVLWNLCVTCEGDRQFSTATTTQIAAGSHHIIHLKRVNLSNS